MSASVASAPSGRAPRARGTTSRRAALRDDQLSLIPDAAHHLHVQYVPRETMHPDPAQPRTHPDAELAASVAVEGILQPIPVRPHPERLGEWMILDGERRWRASEGLMAQVPVIVREDQHEHTDARRLVLQLAANTGKPLTPIEQARAYARLVESGMSTTEAAASLGVSTSTFAERLRLLELGPWLDLIEDGRLPLTHAVEHLLPIRSIPDEVHAQIIERMGAIEPGMSSRDFGAAFRDAARPFFYPLAKAKHADRPTFNTAKHDAECSCGAPAFQMDWQGKRKCCGNPDWWRPLHKQAIAAKKKRTAATASKSKATMPTPGWAKLPEGTKVRIEKSHYFSAGKGETLLVENGKWHLTKVRFDPAVLLAELRPARLCRVETLSWQHEKTISIVTTDAAAVQKGMDAYTATSEARNADILARRRAQLAKDAEAPELAIAGAGARLLLQVLYDAMRFEDIQRLDLFLQAVEPEAPDSTDAKAFTRWCSALDPDRAAHILSLWLAERGCKVPVDRAIDESERALITQLAKTPIKWAPAAAAPAKPTKKAVKEKPLGRYKNGDAKDTPAKRAKRKVAALGADDEEQIDIEEAIEEEREDLEREDEDDGNGEFEEEGY